MGRKGLWSGHHELKGKRIKQLSVFTTTVACTTHDNEAYVWGDCTAFGLGYRPYRVVTPTKLDRKVCVIEVGRNHALMLDEANDVYSIGVNDWGKLGLGDETRRSTWTKVTGLDGERVIKIQCGAHCSAILTDRGLYAMGAQLFGAANEHRNTPTKIKLENVIDISLKYFHILAKTRTGVFAWGWNLEGRCGVDSNEDQIEAPTRVQVPDEFVVLDISAGCTHSILKCKLKK